MSKDKKKKTLKIPSSVICPNCGEKYYYYISKKGKEKGILSGEYEYEGFFDHHYGYSYECYTCGNYWEVRKDKKSLSVKLFPFLEGIMNKKKILCISIFMGLALVIGILVSLTFIQKNQIIQLEDNVVQLENEKKENMASEVVLENCPFCRGKAILQPINTSFYIECEDCELHTDYFDSKYELIQYWNNRN